MMGAPIEQQHRAMMKDIARALDTVFNGDARPKRVAFCLLVANFGDIQDGRVNYISNAERADMIALAKEWLARVEGAIDAPGTATRQ